MGARIEIGEIYGACKVLEELEPHKGRRIVKVRCVDCGEEFITFTANIKKKYMRCTHGNNAIDQLPKDSPCQKCKTATPNNRSCTNYRSCPSWLEWFSQNWGDIRKAAANVRKK